MSTLILKEETPDRLVFVENPDNRKGGIFSLWSKKKSSETTIVLDLSVKRITRTKTTPDRPDEQFGVFFDQLKNITIYAADYSPMPEFQWPAEMVLLLLDGSNFVFNSGSLGEMNTAANKIAPLLGLAVEEKFVSSPKEFPN